MSAIRSLKLKAPSRFQDEGTQGSVCADRSMSERGFMTRMMVLCSLPRTNPGNRKEYKRVNGPYRLYMQAGPETKLPFGKIPSLLLPVSYYLFLLLVW